MSMMPACIASLTEHMNELGIRMAMAFLVVALAALTVSALSPSFSLLPPPSSPLLQIFRALTDSLFAGNTHLRCDHHAPERILHWSCDLLGRDGDGGESGADPSTGGRGAEEGDTVGVIYRRPEEQREELRTRTGGSSRERSCLAPEATASQANRSEECCCPAHLDPSQTGCCSNKT